MSEQQEWMLTPNHSTGKKESVMLGIFQGQQKAVSWLEMKEKKKIVIFFFFSIRGLDHSLN